jgi:hypothetical protein
MVNPRVDCFMAVQKRPWYPLITGLGLDVSEYKKSLAAASILTMIHA